MISELIKERRSIRVFTGEKICDEDINKIIEAGVWAPTGCNNQEIKFIVIGKDKVLAEVLKFKSFFRGVSHFILVMCDMGIPLSQQLYRKSSSTEAMSFLDAGLATQNMVLEAKELNIDSCIVNLTEKHYKKEKGLTTIQKLSKEIKRKFELHRSNPNSFEYFLRNYLLIPSQYKIRAGIALGYGKVYPNINKARHGRNLINRSELQNYIITDKYA